MEKKYIAGILTVLMALITGTTLYLVDLGTKTSCRAGWEYEASGEHEGYYSCTTASGKRYQLCFEVYNSSNTEDYWCRKGGLVEGEEPIINEIKSGDSGNVITCGKANDNPTCW